MIWQKNLNNKSLVLYGKSGTGKTQLALTMLKEKNPLTLTHIEKLNVFDPQVHNSLLFDDCNFEKMTREEIIHLIDNELPRDIRILYNYVTIPKDIIKIFTTNKDSLFGRYENLTEINRRLLKVKINEPLFNKVNLIQIN